MADAVVMEKDVETDAVGTRIYEIGYHVVPTKKEEEIEGVVSAIRGVVEKAGGSFIAEGAPSLTKLSYGVPYTAGGKRMEYDRGYFGWIKFEAPVSAVATLEAALKQNSDVMRSVFFQTVREETRARFKTQGVREVKRGDVLRAAPRTEEVAAPVSEEELEKAIEDITTE